MGFFDKLKNKVEATVNNKASSETRGALNSVKQGINNAANDAIKNFKRKDKTFTFDKLPESVEELKALPQANLQDPFGTVALVILALSNYNKNVDKTVEMLNFLKGPAPLMGQELGRMRDQLTGKDYLMRSYFAGTNPDNNYTPSSPLTLNVFDNPYSYDNEKDGYVTLWVHSSGADNDRQVRLRKKGSTGEWFLNEEYLLPGIRVPKEDNPWA